MGYNIELSFNTLKHNIHDMQELIINIAVENGCNSYYNDFEFENNIRYNRNHCIFTIIFQDYNIKIKRSFVNNYVDDLYFFFLKI